MKNKWAYRYSNIYIYIYYFRIFAQFIRRFMDLLDVITLLFAQFIEKLNNTMINKCCVLCNVFKTGSIRWLNRVQPWTRYIAGLDLITGSTLNRLWMFSFIRKNYIRRCLRWIQRMTCEHVVWHFCFSLTNID